MKFPWLPLLCSKSNSRAHQCHISWNDRWNSFRILTNGSYNEKCSAFIRKVRFDVRKLCYFNLVFIIFENLLFLNFMNLISDLKSSIFGVDFRFFWLTKKRSIESLWRHVSSDFVLKSCDMAHVRYFFVLVGHGRVGPSLDYDKVGMVSILFSHNRT